jgi:hypothetical protein
VEKGLEILREMRLQPDLDSLLSPRAVANLHIGTIMNIYEHEEKAVYAQECLDLLQQLRREGLGGGDAEIVRIENFVRETRNRETGTGEVGEK